MAVGSGCLLVDCRLKGCLCVLFGVFVSWLWRTVVLKGCLRVWMEGCLCVLLACSGGLCCEIGCKKMSVFGW